MARPPGANAWAFAAQCGSKAEAKHIAQRIAEERGHCAWVVTARLPKAPDPSVFATIPTGALNGPN